jgi:hypothetical protein
VRHLRRLLGALVFWGLSLPGAFLVIVGMLLTDAGEGLCRLVERCDR